MNTLLSFDIDSTSKGVWNGNCFQKIFHRTNLIECEAMSDYEIYICLNQCIRSDISSPLCRWYLLKDLEDDGEYFMGECAKDDLINQVLSCNPNINPYLLE